MENKVLKEYENVELKFVVFGTSDLIATSLEDSGANDRPWNKG